MSELVGVGAKVETLQEDVDTLKTARENQATKITALELKASTAGRMTPAEYFKVIAGMVPLMLVVGGLLQIYVKSEGEESLRQVRESLAITSGRLESADERLKKSEEKLLTRNDWMQSTSGSVAELRARVDGLERLVSMSTTERWTATDHANYSKTLNRELELIWKALEERKEDRE